MKANKISNLKKLFKVLEKKIVPSGYKKGYSDIYYHVSSAGFPKLLFQIAPLGEFEKANRPK